MTRFPHGKSYEERKAEIAKDNCPVSKALAGTQIEMNATLVSLVRG